MDPTDYRQPLFIVDEKVARSNIRRMKVKAARLNLKLRPHFKTHNSADISHWFKEEGIETITVSSSEMAAYFASHGWNDITIAFPVNQHDIHFLDQLAAKISLSLVVADLTTVDLINKTLSHKVSLYIKCDTGYGRAGIKAENIDLFIKIADQISSFGRHHFAGLLLHDGHTYKANGVDEIEAIRRETSRKIGLLRREFSLKGYDNLIVSAGDTPSCTISEQWNEIDEIRPGNYLFYDLQQFSKSICKSSQIAGFCICPVIQIKKEESKVLIHGGAVHFGKDIALINGISVFAAGWKLKNKGEEFAGEKLAFIKEKTEEKGGNISHPNDFYCFLSSVSQEHGTVEVTGDYINEIEVGDLLLLIPAHSCLTARQFNFFYSDSGARLETGNGLNH